MFGERSPNSEKNRGVRARCAEDREGADFLLLHFTTVSLYYRGKRLLDRLFFLLISVVPTAHLLLTRYMKFYDHETKHAALEGPPLGEREQRCAGLCADPRHVRDRIDFQASFFCRRMV